MQGNAQLVVGLAQLWVHLVQALGSVFIAFGRREVGHGIEVNIRIVHMRPVGFDHFQPGVIGLQSPLQHPFRLVFLGRNEADNVLVQSWWQGVRFYIGDEAGRIMAFDKIIDLFRHDVSYSLSVL